MLKFIKKYKYIITILLILATVLICVKRTKTLKENNIKKNNEIVIENIIKEEKEEIEVFDETIKIDIKGQVINPGVYELNKGSRVIDAVNVAGGLTDIANTSLINLSKYLEDQMVIIIYSDEEVLNSNVKEIETVFKVIEKECVCPNIKNDSCINTELDNEQNDENNVLININTGTLEELMSIPNLGEVKAQSIIEYRTENRFNSIEDIMNVSGIGEKLFEKIKTYITI